jgi:hypothetical protein
MNNIPARYRTGKPSRHCHRENPYAGPCSLPGATSLRWYICPRCDSHWFTEPSRYRSTGWRWVRLETRLREAAAVGLRAATQHR